MGSLKFKNFVYKFIRFTYTYFTLVKQLALLQLKTKSLPKKTAMILISKNKSYFYMALICLSSFLYYNSDYKIKIFCDQKLSKYTKYFKHFFRKFQIVIDDSIPNNSDPYIEQLKLFFKLREENSILLDADIRWLSKLHYEFNSPLVYNYEFDYKATDFWDLLSKHLNLKHVSNFQVLTCCLTSWGGENPDLNEIETDLMIRNLGTFDWKRYNDTDYYRLRGQFIMSYIFCMMNKKPISITEIEKSKGPIMETSFFGATGYRFGF